MTGNLRGLLALVLLEEARWPEAEAVARTACAATGRAVPAPQLLVQLDDARLCEGDGARR